MKIRISQLLFAVSLMSLTITPAMAADDPATKDDAGQTSIQPQISNVETDDYVPPTRSERFRKYLTGTFGSKALNKSVAAAEINQLRNIPKEWGKHPAGFGTRFTSAFGEHFVRTTLQYGASSVLHEDNRYFRSGKKGFWKRTGYALSSTFLARRDDGRRRFSISKTASAGGAAFISRSWLPGTLASAGAGASSFGVLIAFDAGSNMFREFWPDLKRSFRRK